MELSIFEHLDTNKNYGFAMVTMKITEMGGCYEEVFTGPYNTPEEVYASAGQVPDFIAESDEQWGEFAIPMQIALSVQEWIRRLNRRTGDLIHVSLNPLLETGKNVPAGIIADGIRVTIKSSSTWKEVKDEVVYIKDFVYDDFTPHRLWSCPSNFNC